MRFAKPDEIWDRLASIQQNGWRRNVATAGAVGGVAAGTAGVMSYLDDEDLSSDDDVKQQQLNALNRMYSEGEIDEDEYQEMLASSFSAAEKSDPYSTAL